MPDVGVLQLKISADASAASKSLKTLQTRLSEINTLAQSFNVSNISTQIGNIVSTVKGDKGISTAVKNLGTLLNAIAAFGKVKNIGLTEEQVQRISSLQTAVSGFNLGQAGTQLNKLREALGGEWSTEQASKARDALETLSQGARAVSESGTAEKIKSVSKSIENIAGGTVGNIKGTTSDIVDYEKAVAEMGDTLKENQLIFNEPRRKLNLQFFGGKADNSGFAESTRQIKEVQSVATKAAGPVKQLIDTLNGQIDYKKGKLSDTINNSLGISKPAISDEAKNGMIGLWDSHIQRLDDLNHAADMMKRKLEAPIDYSNIQKYIDMVTGVSRITTQASQETTTAFNMPAMDQNGPFKYASDELVHYTEMLNKAKSDVEFWAKEYESIQNRIKFNGATEERTAALGQAEQSFYAATQAVDDYQARVSEVTEYITKFQEVKESIQQATAAKEEFARPEGWGTGSVNSLIASTNELGRSLRGLNGILEQWQAIRAVSESTGLPIEEINKQIAQTREQSEGARKSIQEMLAALNQETPKMNWAQSIDRMLGIGNEAKSAAESAKVFEQELESGTSEAAERVRELTGTIREQSDETKSLATRFSELAFGTEGLKGAMSRMFPTISGLTKRFSSLIKYRMLRAVIKQISEGFREGYENYYHYSEAIGSSFAPAIDSAASSLLQMKNSIGAAVAPLMQSLVPVLQTVVNWFITAVNWANQFIALLRGQSTWSRAVPTTAKAFEKTGKAAKGASSAMKDLLADWDELNIIQSQGGGGSGSAATGDYIKDYESMFEEVSDFNEDIKLLIDGIDKQFGGIMNLAKRIGIAIAGWKLSTGFAGVLGTLAGLVATGAIIGLEFDISTIFNKNYLKTGDEGWLIADALTMLIGGILMKKVLGNVLKGAFAKVAIPLTLSISALAGITTLLGDTDTSALDKETLVDSAYNALKVGALGGYLLKHAGYSGWQSIGAGGGLAITTMGILIGLKATADTLQTKEFTDEIVKADFLSAGLVGTGVFLTEMALGGGAVTALTLGGGAALITLAALFGVQALLTLSEKDPISWGNYEATEAEIKAFIDNEVFSGAPKTQISLANATIEELGEKKSSLEESAARVIGTLQSVKLGLSSSAQSDLETDLKDFIDTFNQTSTAYQDALKVSVSLVPVSGSADGGQSIVQNSESRWGELNGIMTQLSDDLTKQFDIAYNKDLDEVTRKNAEESIRKISNMMMQIADAVSSGQARAKVAHNINQQIGNLTKGSMDDMLDYYKEQRDALIKELTTTAGDAAEGVLAQHYAFEKLAEYALKEAGGNVEDETYKHYAAQAESAYNDYKERMSTLNEDAERVANETLRDTSGAEEIRNELTEKLQGLVMPTGAEEIFARGGVGDIDRYRKAFNKMLGEIISGATDRSELRKEVEDKLYGNLYDLVGGDNVDTYWKAIENGILRLGDIFDKNFMDTFFQGFGTQDTEEGTRLMQEIMHELFPEYYEMPETPETVVDLEVDDAGITEPTPVPAPDLSAYTSGLNDMMRRTSEAVNYVLSEMNRVNGLGFDISVHAPSNNGGGFSGGVKYYQRAEGGFVRSGDLVMANENGQFEMMGKFGHQPAVANNEQIVTGITRGVSVANDSVVSALNVLIGLAQRIERKEMVAKVVPGTGIGRVNQQSADMFSRVTGVDR